MNRFMDAEFMTAAEKKTVLIQWTKFLAGRFRLIDFTEELYKHLILHASFIAHFSRQGFWTTYFENPEDTVVFLKQFDKDFGFRSVECGGPWWLQGEYEDINTAMCEVFEVSKGAIYEELNRKITERDLAMAQALLAKHHIVLDGKR